MRGWMHRSRPVADKDPGRALLSNGNDNWPLVSTTVRRPSLPITLWARADHYSSPRVSYLSFSCTSTTSSTRPRRRHPPRPFTPLFSTPPFLPSVPFRAARRNPTTLSTGSGNTTHPSGMVTRVDALRIVCGRISLARAPTCITRSSTRGVLRAGVSVKTTCGDSRTAGSKDGV